MTGQMIQSEYGVLIRRLGICSSRTMRAGKMGSWDLKVVSCLSVQVCALEHG